MLANDCNIGCTFILLQMLANVNKSEVKRLVEKLYTINELCDRYSVKPITIWRWIKADKLKAYKIGRSYRIYESDLIRFETEKRKQHP